VLGGIEVHFSLLLHDAANLDCVHLQVPCALFSMGILWFSKAKKKEKVMIKDCNQLVKGYEVEKKPVFSYSQ